MFIPDIFIRGMDAIRYDSAGVEFIVLVDYNHTDKAYEELQIAIDAYDDGHYETRKEAIEEYMNPIGCAYTVFYNDLSWHDLDIIHDPFGWCHLKKEVSLQCPIVKTLEK